MASRTNSNICLFACCVLVLLFVSPTDAKTAEEWKTRTIYQLLTDRFALTNGSTTVPCANLSNYCGGTFKGMQTHLDYIQGMGFDAIWISPVVENTPGGYHGYWMQDLYKINPFFGTEEDLSNFVEACHQRDIWVMFDVVANHVGPVGFDYSTIVPFNQSEYYHECNECPVNCTIQDYTCFTSQVELCRTSGLPDLNQTVPFVYDSLINWINGLVQKFDVDGLRIDTIPEIAPEFWSAFQISAGVYAVGEVFTSDVSCVGRYNQVLDGVLSYPMFFTLRNVFQESQSMNQINETLDAYAEYFVDVSTTGSFIDNQDNTRFLYDFNDVIAYKSVLTYIVMAEGIPIIYYGTEQGFNGGNDPYNREILWPSDYNSGSELYVFLKQLVTLRKSAKIWQWPQVQRFSGDDEFYAFSRGQVLVLLTNQQSNIQRQICGLSDMWSNGLVACDLFYPTTDCITVTNGCVTVYLDNGQSKVYFPVQHNPPPPASPLSAQ